MAELKLTARYMGASECNDVMLNVPDEAHAILKDYTLELIEYGFINTSTIFAIQGGKDIESSNCFGKSAQAFNDCVEKLYKSLKGKKRKKLKK